MHNAVQVDNPHGAGPILLVCDHASNHIPPAFDRLGLSPEQLEEHSAWDIGAWDLARALSQLLDSPLVGAAASRLLIDPNRDFDAPDLIPVSAEGVPIPGNQGLSQAERALRLSRFHDPFHDAIHGILKQRTDLQAIVSVHSFTPVLFGKPRIWNAGILHADDARLADLLIAQLAAKSDLTVGRNEPYGPGDGVYYTLDRHAAGLATAMIEVRNDQLRDTGGQQLWAGLLAEALESALARL